MFDINADDGSVRKRKYESPIPGGKAPGAQSAPANKLDSPEMQQLWRRLLNNFTRELDKQHDNRVLMALDEDFYDNYQWSEEDAATLEERGQKPLVYNVISASIDWVLGTERRTRTDFKILPRRKDDSDPAQRKTELLKYLSDVNRTPFHVSRAFADAVKVGIGWIEDAITDGDEEEPLYSRYESWRNILWDSNATELDLSEARYLFRAKWYDEDIACAMFPKRKEVIRQAVTAADAFVALDAYGDEIMDSQEVSLETGISTASDRVTGFQRQRVRLIEGWIRLPVTVERIRGGTFHGEIYDGNSRGHAEAIAEGDGEIVNKVAMRMHVCIFTEAGLVWCSESPYRHNQFPFTPVWGKRRGRNNLPYGMIRGLKDIQEDVNKRASKAQWLMSTNGVVMDHDALDGTGMDLDELAEEVARPDYIITKKKGTELKVERNGELSQYQLELMSRSISLIQQSSGVTDELLGRETGAKSGIAIQRRQDQGAMATSGYFDNLHLAQQLRGEKLLANVEQFMDSEKQFRITNSRGKPQYININDGLPENDIVRSKADFVIDETDWHATTRQAQVDALLEVMSKFPPQVSLVMLDLAVENMDLPNREDLVKRIRAMTGQHDPDSDEPSPEEQANMQAKQEADAITKATAIANLRKLTAEAGRLEAQIQREMAAITGANVDSQAKALAAAGTAFALPPPAVHAADMILSESGFQSASDKAAALAPRDFAPIGLGQQPPPMPPQPTPAPAPL